MERKVWLLVIFVFALGATPISTDKEKNQEQEALHKATEKITEIMHTTNPESAKLSPEELKERVERVILINAKASLEEAELLFIETPRPENYAGELPNKLDRIYAYAHKSRFNRDIAIQVGFMVNKLKTNLQAGLALIEFNDDREPLKKMLEKIGNWDQRLINLAVDAEPDKLSQEHFAKFADFWLAIKKEKEKRFRELLEREIIRSVIQT